jgi:hypothetical protein
MNTAIVSDSNNNTKSLELSIDNVSFVSNSDATLEGEAHLLHAFYRISSPRFPGWMTAIRRAQTSSVVENFLAHPIPFQTALST